MKRYFSVVVVAVMALALTVSPVFAESDGDEGGTLIINKPEITVSPRIDISPKVTVKHNPRINVDPEITVSPRISTRGGDVKVKVKNDVRTNTKIRTSTKTYQDQYQGQKQGQVGINVQKDKNKQSVTVEGDLFEAAKIPVSSARAPSLTSGNDTCMGSTSIGAQGMDFGLSFGTTWIDQNCIRLKNANALNALGHKGAALSVLAINPDVAAALRANAVLFKAAHVEEVKTVKTAEAGHSAAAFGFMDPELSE
jgi:hypothetical protein